MRNEFNKKIRENLHLVIGGVVGAALGISIMAADNALGRPMQIGGGNVDVEQADSTSNGVSVLPMDQNLE